MIPSPASAPSSTAVTGTPPVPAKVAGEERSAVHGAGGDAVVFVGGCDRSGTTIVSRLIAERASLVVLPEAYFHAVAYRRYGSDVLAEQAIRHWRRRSWGLPSGDTRAHGCPLNTYLRARMTDAYESRRGIRQPLRVVESTPENIEVASILLDQFPDAVLVHVVRDPRAVVSSLRRADFGPTTAQECARLWKQRVASGLAAETNHPDRVIRLAYESALRGDSAALGRLPELLPDDRRFAWDPDRDLLADPTSRRLQSRIGEPPDPRRTDGWRTELSPQEIAAVEYECRELMQMFGYELIGVADPRSSIRRSLDTFRSALSALSIDAGRRAARILRSIQGW